MRWPTPPTGSDGAGITNTAPGPATTPATELGSHDQRSTTAVLEDPAEIAILRASEKPLSHLLGCPYPPRHPPAGRAPASPGGLRCPAPPGSRPAGGRSAHVLNGPTAGRSV